MEMKHTPGPWEVISADWDENGDARYSLNGIKEVNICDARLIAAAPDLLEAIKVCLKAEKERIKKLLPGAPATTYCEKRISIIEAAIAKATGEGR